MLVLYVSCNTTYSLFILGNKVSGIITFVEPNEEAAEALKSEGIHVVLLGRKVFDIDIDTVSTDDFLGGYKVGKYLIEKGCKKIGYLGAPFMVECAQRRLAGLRKSLDENGIAYDDRTGKLYLTGKNWPRLFEVVIEDK